MVLKKWENRYRRPGVAAGCTEDYSKGKGTRYPNAYIRQKQPFVLFFENIRMESPKPQVMPRNV